MPDQKNPYQKAIDTSLPLIGDAKAVVITDFHPHMDKTHQYAFGLAKKTGMVVGMEMITPAEEQLIRAFEDKQITRGSFVTLMQQHFDNGFGPKWYVGDSRAYQFYENMAQNIESGVKIRAAGTYEGSSPILANPDTLKLQNEMKAAIIAKDIDYFKFMTKNQSQFNTNPQALFDGYAREIDSRRESLDEKGQTALADILNSRANGGMHTPQNFQDGVLSLFHAQHPLTGQIMEMHGKWQQIERRFEAETKSSDFDLPVRLAADRATAALGVKLVNENPEGAIIVYGRAHTTHSNRDGFDLDSGLRGAGINTVIFDPRLPMNEVLGRDVLPQIRNENIALLVDSDREIKAENDPNRYSVDLKSGRITPALPNMDGMCGKDYMMPDEEAANEDSYKGPTPATQQYGWKPSGPGM